ncbi:hypothetical protein YPPY03_2893, partial [Yersinia pestis PY-03]
MCIAQGHQQYRG